jgi:hypothetical protein
MGREMEGSYDDDDDDFKVPSPEERGLARDNGHQCREINPGPPK